MMYFSLRRFQLSFDLHIVIIYIANLQTLNSLGPLCNQPLDCKCAPNVECLDDDKCGPCPPGYTGDGFECEKIRPCELEPCHPGNDFDF